MMTLSDLNFAIAELAKLIENGELMAETMPVQFIKIVTTEIKRMMEERTWKLIETAPKDGTEILAVNKLENDPSIRVVFWDSIREKWISTDPLAQHVGFPGLSHWMKSPSLFD